MSGGQDNAAFDRTPERPVALGGPEPPASLKPPLENNVEKKGDPEEDVPERAMWGNQLEFLMSCIATSVGLGNVWRFPFVAYQNGGGAFLIPYVIVLILIGKPMYYLECVLGQFSSRNSIRVWALSPGMKGTGYAQALACSIILTYYVSIIGLCLYYLIMSFQATLPWAVCDESWTDVVCVPSDKIDGIVDSDEAKSSAELYFVRTVLQQSDSIVGGLGLPIWYLTLFLLAAWVIIFGIVARGVKSSGKASYFLAIFPYVVMIILLISTVILPGAGKGILFFLTPQWDKLIDLNVWYAAVTQVFFSISVCTGAIVMFSSYNNFRHNIYRDAMIVTTLDTFTSLLSGITIFGILGNLAHVLNTEVENVVGSGGTGLAFISYPDAIAKTPVPQLFSVLFFLMMTVLGIGSGVALLSCINTVMLDAFPRVPTIFISAFCCTAGFAIGLVYVTPGGQWILELVDHFGGTFLVLFTAISEIIGVMWIYGVENVCLDIEFMLGIRTSMYWRLCWGVITPAMMITVFVYAFVAFDTLLFGGEPYPAAGYAGNQRGSESVDKLHSLMSKRSKMYGMTFDFVAMSNGNPYIFDRFDFNESSGYAILFVGIAFVPLFIILTMYKNKTGNFIKTIIKTFRPKSSWGPRNVTTKREWELFKTDAKADRKKQTKSKLTHMGLSLIGGYKRN